MTPDQPLRVAGGLQKPVGNSRRSMGPTRATPRDAESPTELIPSGLARIPNALSLFWNCRATGKALPNPEWRQPNQRSGQPSDAIAIQSCPQVIWRRKSAFFDLIVVRPLKLLVGKSRTRRQSKLGRGAPVAELATPTDPRRSYSVGGFGFPRSIASFGGNSSL